MLTSMHRVGLLSLLVVSTSEAEEVVVWTKAGRHILPGDPTGNMSDGVTKLRPKAQISPNDQSVRATKNDVMTKFGDAQMRSICKSLCDGYLDDWFVAGTTDPYPDDAPSPSYIVPHVDDVSWSGLDSPKISSHEGCYTCDNSNNTSKMKCHPSIMVTRGTQMTHSTTTNVGFSQSLEFEVEIPEVFTVTSTSTFSVSTSDTTTQTDSSASSDSLTGDVPVPPHEQKCSKVEMKTISYSTTFSMPICLSGGFRCDYSSRCNGHYFWYGDFEDYSVSGAEGMCTTLKGTANAETNTVGSFESKDGACEESCPSAPRAPAAAVA